MRLFPDVCLARVIALVLFGLFAAVGSFAALPHVAWAQDTTAAIDYGEWEKVSKRAEAAVDQELASDQAFEALRAEIVKWREQFLAGQSANAARLRTLSGQIVALGTPPAEGEAEDAEIATRRKDLAAQLTEAQAPVKRAEEAFSLADGLVGEIDRVLRERQADAMLKLGPTPINPALWPNAISELTKSLRSIGFEITTSWKSEAKRKVFQDGLPITLLYLLIAALLLARGRAVMEKVTGQVLERSKGRARAVAGFITSLGQIILPVLGISLLVQALQSTGLLGLRGQTVVGGLPLLGLIGFGGRWLALRLFPKRDDIVRLLPIGVEQSRYMRYYSTSMGVLVGIATLLARLTDYEAFPDAVTVVLFFPLIVLIGVLLFRVGMILVRAAKTASLDKAEGEPTFGIRSLMLAGRVAVGLGVVGTALLTIGYLNAGVFLILPTVLSLALMGLLLVLNDVIRELYALATRRAVEEAREALIPTLVGLLMALTSLPLFALLWGARISDLTELLASFKEGFSFGDTRISPSNFLTFAAVFSVLYLATRLIQSALRTSVLPKTGIDPGGQNAITSGFGYIGIILASIIAITTAGIDLSSLAIVAGALSIGIGFGLQNIVSNFVSGIILLIERPISQGDWIEVGGNTGIVKDISVRSTRIETFDRIDVIVPNADFVTGAVKNWTRGNVIGRVTVPVGVAYGTNTRRVEKILMEIAMENPLVTMNPEPGVDFLGFGADSLDFRIRAVIRDVNFSVAVRTELNHRIAERFAEEGIEIPFAQRDVWLRNPEALRRGGDIPKPEPAVEKPVQIAEVSSSSDSTDRPSGAGIRNIPPLDDDDDDDGPEGNAR